MFITSKNKDYTAERIGIKMKFFYKKELKYKLNVKASIDSRRLLNDWARLNVPPAKLQKYYALIEQYIGANVDDVVQNGSKYYINGKLLETTQRRR